MFNVGDKVCINYDVYIRQLEGHRELYKKFRTSVLTINKIIDDSAIVTGHNGSDIVPLSYLIHTEGDEDEKEIGKDKDRTE
jgi:hypothetical protein